MIVNSKTELRKEYKNIRNSINSKIRQEKSKIICNKLLDFIVESKFENVFIYNSFSSEVDTKDVIGALYVATVNVFLPKCNIETETMKAIKYDPNNEFAKNIYGIEEVVDLNESEAKELDLIVVPGIAFDVCGNRIGYGKGYYDKFISATENNPLILGICYSEQICDKFYDVDVHDRKMDIIFTDTEDYYINISRE